MIANTYFDGGIRLVSSSSIDADKYLYGSMPFLLRL